VRRLIDKPEKADVLFFFEKRFNDVVPGGKNRKKIGGKLRHTVILTTPCQNQGSSSTFSDKISNFQTLKTSENNTPK
jgi:hypothetical protein